MILHDVAVTQDSVRMVCVGTLTASSDGLHPSKCRAEKQIIGQHICTLYMFLLLHLIAVYNMAKDEIEK